MEKTLVICGKAITFKATALTPRLYRHKFGRDMLTDIQTLRTALEEVKAEKRKFEALDLEIFENAAYIMAKQADANIPATADEWLDQFEMFSIYQVLPELLQLWAMNSKTTAESKKN